MRVCQYGINALIVFQTEKCIASVQSLTLSDNCWK